MYIINEYQTNNGSTAIVTPVTKADINEAESVYHQKLASAAISNVEIHAVSLDTEEGIQIKHECFQHTA